VAQTRQYVECLALRQEQNQGWRERSRTPVTFVAAQRKMRTSFLSGCAHSSSFPFRGLGKSSFHGSARSSFTNSSASTCSPRRAAASPSLIARSTCFRSSGGMPRARSKSHDDSSRVRRSLARDEARWVPSANARNFDDSRMLVGATCSHSAQLSQSLALRAPSSASKHAPFESNAHAEPHRHRPGSGRGSTG
jgi:hypothetical protein